MVYHVTNAKSIGELYLQGPIAPGRPHQGLRESQQCHRRSLLPEYVLCGELYIFVQTTTFRDRLERGVFPEP
jgi:hypothetical protein